MEIRSYRRVFELERRIYRIDRLRLNPSGVPLRGLAYFAALLACAMAVSAVPLVGALVKLAPWYVRGVVGPGLTAAALTVVRIEGRCFHFAAMALARQRLRASHSVGLRPRRRMAWRRRPVDSPMLARREAVR